MGADEVRLDVGTGDTCPELETDDGWVSLDAEMGETGVKKEASFLSDGIKSVDNEVVSSLKSRPPWDLDCAVRLTTADLVATLAAEIKSP